MESIQKKLDQGEYGAGVLLTLKRVLTLDHYILINKLEHYGDRGVTREWFFHI